MNDNELDNLIKGIYSKRISEPFELEMSIKNAFKDKNSSFIKQKILKLVPVVCSFVVILSGIVYAKDIESYFKKIFTNSTEAIDMAVENGYFQQNEMDYVYDNDIGIKVDNLILDDLNLDISFCYEIKKENVSSICIEQYTILGDNEQLIYEYESDDIAKVGLAKTMSRNEGSLKVSDKTYTDSILYELREKENSLNTLNFEIRSLRVTYTDNTSDILNGNWKFNVTINDEMKKNSSLYYIFSENNEYVEKCKATLSATGMIVELELKEAINPNETIFKVKRGEEIYEEDIDLFYLKYNNEKHKPSSIEPQNTTYTKYIIHYNNIGVFFENADKFELYLAKFDTTIILNKEKN